MMILKGGGYKSQMSDYTPWNYIGTSQLNKDLSWDVNSEGQIRIIFDRIFSKKSSYCGVATRRGPITFENGDEREDPNSILWEKVRVVEGGYSKVKDGTVIVQLHSHDKIRIFVPIPRYSPHSPLPTPPLLFSDILLSHNAQKGTLGLK